MKKTFLALALLVVSPSYSLDCAPSGLVNLDWLRLCQIDPPPHLSRGGKGFVDRNAELQFGFVSQSPNSPKLPARSLDQCPPDIAEFAPNWKLAIRTKALKNFDRFLNMSAPHGVKKYPTLTSKETVENTNEELISFAQEFGYFSSIRPIVAKVTKSHEDVDIVCCVLKDTDSPFARDEILSKVLAYRELKRGDVIMIPVKGTLETFEVDEVFNLWRGMPAYGLVPDESGVSSILLFRGTDFSVISRRGWASMMSDLDITGPGLSTFKKAQDEIHEWLEKVDEEGKTARVLGYSLGGALAAYTFIYENQLIAADSVAFCPPGISEKVIEDFELLSDERKQDFRIFVDEGDLVSKVGLLFGDVNVLSVNRPLRPVAAHTALMSGEPSYSVAPVDVEEENHSRAVKH